MIVKSITCRGMIAKMNDLADWVITQIEQRGWSQRELSRRAGLSQAHISNVLNRVAAPGADFCVAIARALDVQPEYTLRLAGILPTLPADHAREDRLLHAFRLLKPAQKEMAIASIRGMAGIEPTVTGKAPDLATEGDDGSLVLPGRTNELILTDGGRNVIIALANTLARLATADQLDLASALAEQLLQQQIASGDNRETLDGGRSDQVDAGIPALQEADRGAGSG